MEDRERYRTGERAIAPIVATVIPALIVTVLMVVTAISSRPREEFPIDVGRPSEDTPIEPMDDPPEELPPEQTPPPEDVPEITVDTDLPPSRFEDLMPPQPIQPAE